jgi:hypothetical protein
MFYKCLTGRTVNVEHSCEIYLKICSSSTAVEYDEFDRSNLENDGASIYFDSMDEDCKVPGDGILQKEQEVLCR